jgi:hypothetical protein
LLRTAALLSLSLFACQDAPNAERPLQDHGEAPADPIGASVHAWGVEAIPRMAPTEYLRGEVRPHEVADHPQVLLGSHCYTFLAESGDGIDDLNLVLLDPSGTPLLTDSDEGKRAALGLRQQICPDHPGSYVLRVRAFRGAGEFVVRVYEYSMI